MISLNSMRSLSEYLMVGPDENIVAEASRTDLVNSGSYFTELLVVVLGMITFMGFGGSFLITGFTFCLIDTSDLGSALPGFFTRGLDGSGLATGLTTGLAAGFATALATGFLGAGLAAF